MPGRAPPPAGRALFISDLHLAPFRPRITAQFQRFCTAVAGQAEALYVLGDLFEVWIGDDTLAEPFNQSVAAALKQVADAGTAVFFMHGNRDFLAAAAFAQAAGLTLLSDPTEVTLHGRRVLLLHGDTLCTDDKAYQAFRRQVRDPAFQAQFLSLPVDARRQQAGQARSQSEQQKQLKAMDIMDVTPAAIDELLRTHGYPDLIHGHTHRPATHAHSIDGRHCERWVLADWRDDACEYLRVDASGWRRCAVSGDTA